MALEKPPSIANDDFKSAKWNEITKDRNFSQADIPVIALLCQWYAVIQRCTDDIDEANGQVAFMNDMGDLKALPQINIMKQASAEMFDYQLNRHCSKTINSNRKTTKFFRNIFLNWFNIFLQRQKTILIRDSFRRQTPSFHGKVRHFLGWCPFLHTAAHTKQLPYMEKPLDCLMFLPMLLDSWTSLLCFYDYSVIQPFSCLRGLSV